VSVIRTGNPALNTSGGVVQEDMDDARQFLRMLHRGSATGVREALKILRQVIPAPDARILDLGGGHGRYAATFAAAFPDARVTLYDREIATQIAREISGEAFSTISGDFLRDTLANDDHPAYEVVFMSYIVSGIAIEEVGALFKRVRAVIPQGGVVIVQDMYVDADDHLSPASAIDFHLTLLLENERGRFRTVPEICELLREAGFTRTQHITANGHEFSYIVAW
jgi:cyclopropane fatty-acyl-phospholipid synthase-like methyltransferase